MMIKIVLYPFIFLLLFVGCSTTFDGKQSYGFFNKSDAIRSLNRQFKKWNAENAGYGIFPISQRVVRTVYNPSLGKVTCFDKHGEAFLVLNREPNGRFKGVLEVEYTSWSSDPESGISEEWGVVFAEFYLEKGMF